MFKRNKFIFISVFAHLIVLYIVARSVMFPSEPDSPPKKRNIIQATLIFDVPLPPPEIPAEVVEEERPLPIAAETEEVPPVVETPIDNQTAPMAEPEVKTITIAPEAQEPPPLPKQEEEIPEASKQNSEIMIKDKKSTTISNSEIRSPVTSMAKRHLNNFQQQQRNKMAAHASRYYQQHKNSPVIDAEVKDPFMSEDEKLRDNLKVRADCSSTSKKTTAVVLGFLGAQIDCSKPPPITGFIKNRINKQSHLPGQYKQKEQKRPQSVVIKTP